MIFQSVATKLGLSEDHLAEVIAAIIRSAWITFLAFSAGILVAGSAAGAKTPREFLDYAQANWLLWLVTNLVAPTVRGARAASTPPQK
jgi:hypothetical protein